MVNGAAGERERRWLRELRGRIEPVLAYSMKGVLVMVTSLNSILPPLEPGNSIPGTGNVDDRRLRVQREVVGKGVEESLTGAPHPPRMGGSEDIASYQFRHIGCLGAI